MAPSDGREENSVGRARKGRSEETSLSGALRRQRREFILLGTLVSSATFKSFMLSTLWASRCCACGGMVDLPRL